MRRPRPKLVKLETERFVLRTLKPSDVSDRYIAWAVDPDIMGPLNAPVRKLTVEGLSQHIRGFDNATRCLIGVFDASNDLHIGFYRLNMSLRHRNVTFTVVIGDKSYWGHKVVLETRAALLDHVFDARGMEKAVGRPFARNFPAVFNYKAQGWRLEGIMKGHARSVSDGSRLDQYQFGLLPDEWRARRNTGAGA
ncbi:MAG: GNAT family N-acetyltransferase [Methyloligellaceae bacterium]